MSDAEDYRLHAIDGLPPASRNLSRRVRLPESIPAVHGIGNLSDILPVEEVVDGDGRKHRIMMSHLPTFTTLARNLHVINARTNSITGCPDQPRPFDAYRLHNLTGDHRFLPTPDVASRGSQPRNEHAQQLLMNPGEDVHRELRTIRDQEALDADQAQLASILDEQFDSRTMPEPEADTLLRMSQDELSRQDTSGLDELSSISQIMSDMDRSQRAAVGGASSSKLGTARRWHAGLNGESDSVDMGDVHARGTVSAYSERDERERGSKTGESDSIAGFAEAGLRATTLQLPGAERMLSSEGMADAKRVPTMTHGDRGDGGGGDGVNLGRLLRRMSLRDLQSMSVRDETAAATASRGVVSEQVHAVRRLAGRLALRDVHTLKLRRAGGGAAGEGERGDVSDQHTRKLVRALARKELALRASRKESVDGHEVDEGEPRRLVRRAAATEIRTTRGAREGGPLPDTMTPVILLGRHSSKDFIRRVADGPVFSSASPVMSVRPRLETIRRAVALVGTSAQQREDLAGAIEMDLAQLPQRASKADVVQQVVRRSLGAGLDSEAAAEVATSVVMRMARDQAAGRTHTSRSVGGPAVAEAPGMEELRAGVSRLAKRLARTEIETGRQEGGVVVGGMVDVAHGRGRLVRGQVAAEFEQRRAEHGTAMSHGRQVEQQAHGRMAKGLLDQAAPAQASAIANDFDAWADGWAGGAGAGAAQVQGRPDRDLRRTIGSGFASRASEFGVPAEDAVVQSAPAAALDQRAGTAAHAARLQERRRSATTRGARFEHESYKSAIDGYTRHNQDAAAHQVDRSVRPGQRRYDMPLSRKLGSDRARSQAAAGAISGVEDRVRARGARMAVYESSDDESSVDDAM